MQGRSATSKKVTREAHLENDSYVCNLTIDPSWRGDQMDRCLRISFISCAYRAAKAHTGSSLPFIKNSMSAPYIDIGNALILPHLPLC